MVTKENAMLAIFFKFLDICSNVDWQVAGIVSSERQAQTFDKYSHQNAVCWLTPNQLDCKFITSDSLEFWLLAVCGNNVWNHWHVCSRCFQSDVVISSLALPYLPSSEGGGWGSKVYLGEIIGKRIIQMAKWLQITVLLNWSWLPFL